MKKNVCYMLSALLFGAVALVGCSQDATTDLAPAEGQGVTLQLTATMPQPDDSRATFNGVNAIWDEDDYLDTWVTDPKQTIAAYHVREKFTLASLSEDKRTAKFNSRNYYVNKYFSDESKIYIVCNESANSTADYRYISVPEIQTYEENGYTNIPLLAQGYVGWVDDTKTTQIFEIKGMKFKNPLALLQLNLKGAEEGLSVSQIVLSDPTDAVISGSVKVDTSDNLSWNEATGKTITLTCGNVALSTTEATSFVIAVPASDLYTFTNGLKVSVSTNKGEYIKTTKALGALNANTIYATPALTVEDQTPAGKAYIPDANFRAKLFELGYIDTADEVYVTITDAGKTATTLNLDNADILNMAGIECFTELTSLSAQSNKTLSVLDLSSQTKLTSLKLNSCSALSDLNISQCTKLTTLEVNYCSVLGSKKNIGEITKNNTELDRLVCNYTHPNLGDAEGAQDVDMRHLTKLTSLEIKNNNLTGLKLAAPGLSNCQIEGGNNLYHFETKATTIWLLYLQGNRLSKVDLTSVTNVKLYGGKNLNGLGNQDNGIVNYVKINEAYKDLFTNLNGNTQNLYIGYDDTYKSVADGGTYVEYSEWAAANTVSE